VALTGRRKSAKLYVQPRQETTMTFFRHTLIAVTILMTLGNCNTSVDKGTSNNTDSLTIASADEDGPPFKDECKANFKRFGEYKISNDNCNIYYSGKGWNPEFYSCSWTWGELVNNEFSDDTTVTFIKIHLLDLNQFQLPDNGTDYGNDSIKKYVIAVYSRDSKGGHDESDFDPFKTGKYSKPKQWTE
jgi:hypothetical protein